MFEVTGAAERLPGTGGYDLSHGDDCHKSPEPS
jgi:hypothetical protein